MAKPFVVSGDSRSTAVDVERTALHVDLLAELVLLLADGHHAIADLDESAAIDISLEGEVLVVAANRPDTLSVELSRTAHAADSNIAAIVVQSYRGVDLRILQASLHIVSMQAGEVVGWDDMSELADGQKVKVAK